MEIARRLAFALALLAGAFIGTVQAQDLRPDSAAALRAVLDEIAARSDPIGQQGVLRTHLADLQAAAQNDPVLASALVYLETRLAGEAASAWELAGVEALRTGQFETQAAMVQGPGLDFVEAAAASSLGIPPSDLSLYRLGEARNGFLALGGSLEDYGPGQSKQVGIVLDMAGKVYKAGRGIDDYVNNNDADVSKDVSDMLGLFGPETAGPALSGPAAAAFADLLGWDANMFDKASQGMGLVNDALDTGHIDQAKLAQLTQQIKDIAHHGPWGTNTAKQFIKKWLGNFPRLNKLLATLWPPGLAPPQCSLIDCDCSNVEAGLLTKPYQSQCKEAQERISKMCEATGTISGACDPAGPAAFPF